MASRKKQLQSLHLSIAVASCVALGWADRGEGSVLFDNVTAHEAGVTGANVTTTGSTPNTYMGDAFALPNGTTDLTGLDLFPANLSGHNYTGLQVAISIWGSVNTGTVNSSSPAFGDFLGSYALTVSGNFTTGSYYPLEGNPVGTNPNITFASPLQLNGISTIGITVNYAGITNGTVNQPANNLTSLISYGPAPTAGVEVFNGFFRNVNHEVNGNFTSGIRSIDSTYTNQSMAMRIFGDVTASSEMWNVPTGGDWQSPGNWSPASTPTSANDAVFNLSSPGYTVSISSAAACDNLYLQSDNVILNLTNRASSLSISGTVTVGQAAAGILGIENTSAASMLNTSAGSVLIGSSGGTGQLTIGTGIRLTAATPIAISTGSRLTVASGAELATPAVSLAGTTGSWTSLLDIGTAPLDLSSASLGTITDQLREGYNNGYWNGSAGITSSAAASDPTKLTALAAIVNNNGSGQPLYGVNSPLGAFGPFEPTLNDALIKYTYYGDANLDGKVDSSDYTLIDNTYLSEQSTSRSGTGWYNGDFNYDDIVNGSDYTLIDNAFNSQGTAFANHEFVAITVVAEPSASVLILSIGLALMRLSTRSKSTRPRGLPLC